MKKTSLVALATLALTFGAFAQENKPANIAGTAGRPASVDLGGPAGSALTFLFQRIHTLDIQTQVQEMEKDGVTERKFAATFSASGALVYQFELRGQNIDDYNDTGRNAGMQIVPYTIKIDGQKNVYAAFNPFSFRNMNTIQSGSNYIGNGAYEEEAAGFFKVVDNIDFVVFKFDRTMSFDNLNTFSIDLVNTDLKLDILNSSKSTRYLAVTAGASVGWNATELRLDNGEIVRIGSEDDNSRPEFGSTSLRYGLEYNDQFSKGGRLNVKMGAQHFSTKGKWLDPQKVAFNNNLNTANQAEYEQLKNQYNADIVTFAEDKKAYEQANMNGTEISDDSYVALTGAKKPVSPAAPKTIGTDSDKVRRNAFYLTPSIEFSKSINKPGKRPVRIGIRGSANIPMQDVIRGGRINLDQSLHNRNLVNGSLFINF